MNHFHTSEENKMLKLNNANINSARLEILNINKFYTWQIYAQALLRKNDLWKYVSKESTKRELPENPTAQENVARQR